MRPPDALDLWLWFQEELKRASTARFALRWGFAAQSFCEGNRMRITTEQKVSVTVVPKTEAGFNTRIDGSVIFESSDPNVAIVTSTGQLTADCVAVGEGVAQIKATFDADLGAGVRNVVMTGALEVVAAEAVTAEIVFGTPQLQ